MLNKLFNTVILVATVIQSKALIQTETRILTPKPPEQKEKQEQQDNPAKAVAKGFLGRFLGEKKKEEVKKEEGGDGDSAEADKDMGQENEEGTTEKNSEISEDSDDRGHPDTEGHHHGEILKDPDTEGQHPDTVGQHPDTVGQHQQYANNGGHPDTEGYHQQDQDHRVNPVYEQETLHHESPQGQSPFDYHNQTPQHSAGNPAPEQITPHPTTHTPHASYHQGQGQTHPSHYPEHHTTHPSSSTSLRHIHHPSYDRHHSPDKNEIVHSDLYQKACGIHRRVKSGTNVSKEMIGQYMGDIHVAQSYAAQTHDPTTRPTDKELKCLDQNYTGSKFLNIEVCKEAAKDRVNMENKNSNKNCNDTTHPIPHDPIRAKEEEALQAIKKENMQKQQLVEATKHAIVKSKILISAYEEIQRETTEKLGKENRHLRSSKALLENLTPGEIRHEPVQRGDGEFKFNHG